MAGELWRGFTQTAVEVTYGTAVQPATRRLYFEDPSFDDKRQERLHKFATATRDNQRAITLGPQEVSGTFVQPLSSSELIELLLMNLAGGITPTQPSAGPDPTVYLWTFTPGSTLNSSSQEWHDGARAWLVSGVLCDKLNIKGSANGPNVVTASLFGKAMVPTTMTGSLSTRTPDVTEGWETKLYVDSIGATPGTTEVDGFLINWDITLSANLGRKYFAQDQNSLGATSIGELGATAVLTFEGAPGQALTEWNNFNVAQATPTYRLVRTLFGNNKIISNAFANFVSVDLPGAWTVFMLGEKDAGTRVYRLTLNYKYDDSNAFGCQVRCQNTRAAAWV